MRVHLLRPHDDSLKRRFEQNQEDCSYTVLALLPTAADSVIDDLPVEKLTQELQQKKADRLAKTAAQKVEASNQITAHREDDNQSLQSFASESHVLVNGATMEEEKPKKTRAQLWNEIKISCEHPAS